MQERVHLFCISVEVDSNIFRMDNEGDKLKNRLLMLAKSCYRKINMGRLVMNMEKPDEIRQSGGCGYKIYVEEMIPI